MALMFTFAKDVYSPGKQLPNRNICFNYCGKSSICWETKKNSQTSFPYKRGQLIKAFADLFVSVREAKVVLAYNDALLYGWDASL